MVGQTPTRNPDEGLTVNLDEGVTVNPIVNPLVVAALMHEMVLKVTKTVEYDQCIADDLEKCQRVKRPGGARKVKKKAVGRPKKKEHMTPKASVSQVIRQKVYSTSGAGLKRLKAWNSVRSDSKESSSKGRVQVFRAKRKLDFGQERKPKHVLAKHERKDPLVFGFVTRQVQRNIRGDFEVAVGQTQYLAENKGNPRMLRCGKRYRLVQKDYEEAVPKMKTELKSRKRKLKEAKASQSRYAKQCAFSGEESRKLKLRHERILAQERKAKANLRLHRLPAVRASERIRWNIRQNRNRWAKRPRMKMYLMWQMLGQKVERLVSQVEEAKRSLEFMEAYKLMEQRRRLQHDADMRLKRRLRYQRWYVNHCEEKRRQVKDFRATMKLKLQLDRRLQYKHRAQLVGTTMSRKTLRRRKKMLRNVRFSILEQYTENLRLQKLCGQLGVLQSGTRVEREGKQCEWRSAVADRIMRRTGEKPWKHCSKAYKSIQREKHRATVECAIDRVLGVKNKLVGHFKKEYNKMMEYVTKWTEEVASSIEECTFESVMRSDAAKIHKISQQDSLYVPRNLDYNVDGEAPCTEECVLPANWGKRVAKKLESLESWDRGIVECLESFMKLEWCDGCVVNQYCCYGIDGCEDWIRLMLAVRPHSRTIRTFLRKVYDVRNLAKKLVDIDTVLLEGTSSEVTQLLQRIGQKQSEEEGRQELMTLGFLPGPPTSAKVLKQKWGHLVDNFHREEQDHPDTVCYFCERLLRKKQIEHRVKALENVKVADSRENFANLLLHMLGKEEWDSEVDKLLDDEDSPFNVCRDCWKYVIKNTIGGPMVLNELWVDDVPDELSALNRFEMFLVCRANPFYSVIRLETYSKKMNASKFGLVKGIKGNAAYLRLSTEETASHVLDTMPMTNVEDRLRIYALSIPKAEKTLWKNLVDMEKVLTALEWLKANNAHYKDICIDKDAAKKIDTEKFVRITGGDTAAGVDSNVEPEDEQVPPLKRMLTETMIPEIESEYVMQTTEEIGVTAGKHVKTYQQVKVQGTPLNFGTTDELDMMSLPALYPRGRGGVGVKRKKVDGPGKHVRPREFFKYRLQHKSGRFRRTSRFLHVGTYLKRERAVGQGMYAATKTGSKMSNMKAKQILKRIKEKDVELERDLTTAFASIKGTQEYWNRVRGDVQATDEALGPATFFVTLSCAEFHWGEMERYLRQVNADLPGVGKMSLQQLLMEDPVTVSEFFMRRFKAFLDQVILAKDENGEATEGPLGLVEHFFWRLEYQARGAPHIHMKLWVKDAPVVVDNTAEEVLLFIAKYIRGNLPNEEENRELFNIVMANQVHKCTGSCMRYVPKKKGRGFKRCRYGYPMPPCENYELNDFEESVKSHTNRRKRVKKLYNVPRDESDTERSINPYNPLLLSAWKANMDIQFLGEKSRVLNAYITGYITKGEKDHTESIWESLNEDKSVSSRIMSMIYERFRDREVGAYEMADDLLGNDLHGASESVVHLGVGLPWKRTRKMKKFAELKRLDPDSTDTLESNLIETYYPNRHKDLRDTCLYDMVRLYNFKRAGKDEAKDVADGEDEEDDEGSGARSNKPKKGVADWEDEEEEEGRGKKKKYWCTNKVGYFVKRRKPAIPKVRYVSCDPASAEEYFQSLLQQFVPYALEEELMRGKDTYKEAFDEWVVQPGGHLLSAARDRKEKVQAGLNLKKRLEEEATEEEARDEQENVDVEYYDEELPTSSTGFRAVSDYKTDEGLEKRVSSLNPKQLEVYDEILEEVRKQDEKDADAKQILKFVSGGDGVGKSKLIETLTEGVEKLTSHGVVLAAPTGMAAQNIEGRTAHAVFRLSVQKNDNWPYVKLDPTRMKQMYAEIGKSKLIVIDEVSMVSNRALVFIHLRLQEMTGCAADVLFGGFNIVVLGDLLQLPPVGMKGMPSPYVFHSLNGKEMRNAFPGTVIGKFPLKLWKEFSYSELTQNMRQQDDRSYADMLNELRVGKVTEATLTALKSKVVENVEQSVEGYAAYLMKLRSEGLNPLCLMALRKQVREMNLAVFSKENIRPYLLHAKDQSLGRRKAKVSHKGKFIVDDEVDWKSMIKYVTTNSAVNDTKTAGLEDIVLLGEGARVMLRRNLDVEKGLYNGAQGVVRKVVVNNKSPDGVSAVMVEFDSAPGEFVRVERATGTWHKGRSIEVKREQFPLCLSYAITIHKSQGLSLDCVVSALGKDIFTYGMAYVVLSRLRKLDGLHLLEFLETSVKCDTKAVKEYNRLRAKYEPDLPMLEVQKEEELQGKTVLQKTKMGGH